MKTRKQKVICIFACIFLLASFFVLPVSAAESPEYDYISDGFNVKFDLKDSGIDSAFVCGFTTDNINTLLNYWDTHTFNEIKSLYPSDLDVSEGEYDYEYYSYDSSSYPSNFGNPSIGIFTLAFSGDSIFGVQSIDLNKNYLLMCLTSGNMQYFTRNLEVDYLRYSIRDVSTLGVVGTVSHFSSLLAPWRLPSSPEVIGSDAVYNYVNNLGTSTWLSARDNAADLIPNNFVFCVDVIVRDVRVNGNRPSDFGFGFDVDTTYSGMIVGKDDLVIIGDKIVGMTLQALLSLPMYEMPDMSFIDETLQLQGSITGKFDDASGSLTNLVSQFRRGLNNLSTGMQSVSALFEYFIGRTPIFGAVVTFSLVLGLLAFILSFTSSMIGASASIIKSHTSHSRSESKPRTSNKKGDDD